MASKELKDLREAVKHSERLASAKIRRMSKGQDGYDVTGTNLDPRKPKGWIDRANKKQLEAYRESLAYFRRPSVGWVKSSTGQPIKRQVLKNMEAAARKRNRDVERIESRIADIHLPWAGKTVGEVRATRNGTRKRAINNEQGVRTTIKEKWRSKAFMNESSVHQFASKNLELNSKSVFKLKVNDLRSEFAAMVEGSPIADKIDKLTDSQLWLAWSTSPHMANSAKLVYELLMAGIPYDDVYSNEVSALEGIIDEAAKIDVPENAFYV